MLQLATTAWLTSRGNQKQERNDRIGRRQQTENDDDVPNPTIWLPLIVLRTSVSVVGAVDEDVNLSERDENDSSDVDDLLDVNSVRDTRRSESKLQRLKLEIWKKL